MARKRNAGARGAYGAGKSRSRREPSASDQRTSGGFMDEPRGNLEVLRRSQREMLKFIDDVPLFDELHTREREAIAEMAEIVRCPGGTVIYETGEEGRWFYVILQGEMELRTRIGPGMQHTFRMIGPGKCAGVDAVLSRSDYHMQCVAREKTAALRMVGGELLDAVERGVPAAVKLFAAMGTQLGADIRAATLDVVHMLEKTSMMPAKSDTLMDEQKMASILGKG